ncbi:MAG: CheY-P-specific phosphatase CheC, partial [Lachnospiraceae bacterium]|nr:CheY-P-specific phosphatase CheC [Lachnospiraceae bacterium]
GIMLGVESDIEGSMMFLMDMESAHHIVNRLMMRPADYNEPFDEMDLSAVKEIGNIIAGSYLSALSGLTNLVITPTIPFVSVDMAAAILSVPAIQFGMMGDNALMIKTEFSDELAINGYFILMPEEDSYEKILTSLGLSL